MASMQQQGTISVRNRQLNIPEAALLAGLVKRPSYFSPYKHPDHTVQRRNEVIDAMAQDGSISAEQASEAKEAGLAVVTR